MATGDITSPVIPANGMEATFHVAGLDYTGLTAFESGKSITFDVDSDGYSSGTLQVQGKSRTVTGYFKSASDASVTYVNDTFTEGGDTALGSHDPETDVEAGGWSVVNGAMTVSAADDEVAPSGADPGSPGWLAVIDTGVSDNFRVTSSQNRQASGGNDFLGVIFRSNSSGTEFLVAVWHDNSSDVELYKYESSAYTKLAENTSFSLNTAETIRVEVVGDAIEVFISDVSALTHTLSSGDQTTFGSNEYCGLRFDHSDQTATDFSVASITNDATVTVALGDPIHGDCAVTGMDADEGLLNDGTNSSNAISGGSVTNNSTLDYPVGAIHICSVHHNRETSTFDVWIAASSCSAYTGYRSTLGVDQVELTVTDKMTVSSATGDFNNGETITWSGGSAVCLAHDGTEMWISDATTTPSGTITGSDSGETATYVSGGVPTLYTASAFDSTGWDRVGSVGKREKKHNLFKITVDTDGMAQGVATMQASIKPKIGDANSVREARKSYFYADPSDNLTTSTAYVDSSGTATATGGGLSAGVSEGDILIGDTSGAKAILTADHDSGETTLSLAYHSGTFSNGEDATIYDYDGGSSQATCTLSGTPTWTADGGTPAVNDADNPYRQMAAAASAIGGATQCSHSTIYLKAGWHVFDGSWTEATDLGYATITRDPATSSAADVHIYGDASLMGRTHIVCLEDLTVSHKAGLVVLNESTGTAGGGNGPLHGAQKLILREVVFEGRGRTTSMTGWADSLFDEVFIIGCSFDDTYQGANGVIAIDNSYSNTASDSTFAIDGTLGNVILNNVYTSLNPSGTSAHADILQFTAGADTENIIFMQNAVDDDVAGGQRAPFVNGTSGSPTIQSVLIAVNTQTDNQSPSRSNWSDVTLDSVLVVNELHDDTWAATDAGLSITNYWTIGCYFNDFDTDQSDEMDLTIWQYNHNVGGNYTDHPIGDTTTGGGSDDDFEDADTFDWTPTSDGKAVGSVWPHSDWPLQYDADGTEITAGNAGFFGALAGAGGGARQILGSMGLL